MYHATVTVTARCAKAPPGPLIAALHMLDRISIGHFQFAGQSAPTASAPPEPSSSASAATAKVAGNSGGTYEFAHTFRLAVVSPAHTDLRWSLYLAPDTPAGDKSPAAAAATATAAAAGAVLDEPPSDSQLIGYAYVNLSQLTQALETAASASKSTVSSSSGSRGSSPEPSLFPAALTFQPPPTTSSLSVPLRRAGGMRVHPETSLVLNAHCTYTDSPTPALIALASPLPGGSSGGDGTGSLRAAAAMRRLPSVTKTPHHAPTSLTPHPPGSAASSSVSPPLSTRSVGAPSASTTASASGGGSEWSTPSGGPCADLIVNTRSIALTQAAASFALATKVNAALSAAAAMAQSPYGSADPKTPAFRAASSMGNRPGTAMGNRPGTSTGFRPNSVDFDSAGDGDEAAGGEVFALTAANGDARLAWFEPINYEPLPTLPIVATASGSTKVGSAGSGAAAAAALSSANSKSLANKSAALASAAHALEHERAYEAAVADLPTAPDDVRAVVTTTPRALDGPAWQLYFLVECRNIPLPASAKQTGVVIVAFAPDLTAQQQPNVVYVGRTELVKGTSAPHFYEVLQITHYHAAPDREFVLTAYDVDDSTHEPQPNAGSEAAVSAADSSSGSGGQSALEHKHMLGSCLVSTSMLVRSLNAGLALVGASTAADGVSPSHAPALCFPLLPPGTVLHPHHTKHQFSGSKPLLRLQCLRAIQLSGPGGMPPTLSVPQVTTVSFSGPASPPPASSPALRRSIILAEGKSGTPGSPLVRPPSATLTKSATPAPPAVVYHTVVLTLSARHLPRQSALGFTNPVVIVHKATPTPASTPSTPAAGGDSKHPVAATPTDAGTSALLFVGQTEAVLHTCNPDFEQRISLVLPLPTAAAMSRPSTTASTGSAASSSYDLIFSLYTVSTAAPALNDDHLIGRATVSSTALSASLHTIPSDATTTASAWKKYTPLVAPLLRHGKPVARGAAVLISASAKVKHVHRTRPSIGSVAAASTASAAPAASTTAS